MAFDVSYIRGGMEVKSSDGVSLGKVVEVWCGKDPKDSTEECDESVCSRIEVRAASRRVLGRLRRAKADPAVQATLYIPCNAVAGVSGNRVELAVSSETVNASEWSREPKWIWQARGQVKVEADRQIDQYDLGKSRS